MLLVLFNWLYTLMILGSLGILSFFGIQKLVSWDTKTIALDKTVLLGMIVLTAICNYISLFSPIDLKINIIISVLAIGSIIFFRKKTLPILRDWKTGLLQLHWLTKFALFLVFLIAIVKTSGPSLSYDEGGYHLPLIRWIENYPVVPGIANIEDRLGFNPSIYMTNAFFGMTWLFPGGLYDLNAFLFVLFGYSFLKGFDRIVKNNFKDQIFSTTIQTCALFFLFRAYMTSMDADFIFMYGATYLLIIFIQKIEMNKLAIADFDAFLFVILFAFISTSKFIIGLLLPLVLWQAIFWIKSKKTLFVKYLIVACLCIVGGWLIRNYIISGYLIYPLSFTGFFNPDWKVPKEYAEGQYHYVSEYAKIEVTRNIHEYKFAIRDVPWREWLPNWFDRVWWQLIGKVIIIGTPIGFILFFGSMIFSRKSWKKEYQQYLILLSILALATIIWFTRIPAIRFGWGWLLSFLVLSFGLPLRRMLIQYADSFRIGIVAILLASLIRSSILSVFETPELTKIVIEPVPVEKGVIYQTKIQNQIKINIAEEGRCWSISPPCYPRNHLPGLTPIGNKITDGFKIEN